MWRNLHGKPRKKKSECLQGDLLFLNVFLRKKWRSHNDSQYWDSFYCVAKVGFLLKKQKKKNNGTIFFLILFRSHLLLKKNTHTKKKEKLWLSNRNDPYTLCLCVVVPDLEMGKSLLQSVWCVGSSCLIVLAQLSALCNIAWMHSRSLKSSVLLRAQ